MAVFQVQHVLWSDLMNSRPKKQFLKQLNVAIFNFLTSGHVQPEWDLVAPSGPLGGPASLNFMCEMGGIFASKHFKQRTNNISIGSAPFQAPISLVFLSNC